MRFQDFIRFIQYPRQKICAFTEVTFIVSRQELQYQCQKTIYRYTVPYVLLIGLCNSSLANFVTSNFMEINKSNIVQAICKMLDLLANIRLELLVLEG